MNRKQIGGAQRLSIWRSVFLGPMPAITPAALAVRLVVLAIVTEIYGLSDAWPGWAIRAAPPWQTVFTVMFYVIMIPAFVLAPSAVAARQYGSQAPLKRWITWSVTLVLVLGNIPAFTLATAMHTTWPFQILVFVDVVAAIALFARSLVVASMPRVESEHDS